MTHSPDHAEREAILLAVYNKQPMTVFSEWMAEQLGLPLHAPIPLHVVEEKGGSVQPTRDIVNHTIDVMIALRGRDADQQAAAELVQWWDSGVLPDGVVRAEAKAMLAAGKADDHSFIQQAERAIVSRIVRRAALHDAKEA